MQQPTSEEGAILKREWWRTYEGDDIPPFIMSYNLMIQRSLKKKQLTILLLLLGVYSIQHED